MNVNDLIVIMALCYHHMLLSPFFSVWHNKQKVFACFPVNIDVLIKDLFSFVDITILFAV